MGKIKTKRQKLHAPAQSKRKQEDDDMNVDLSKLKASLVPPGSEFPTRGLFSQSAAPPSSGEDHPGQFQRLRADDADDADDRRSFISKKSVKCRQGLTKKEKMKMRHDKWLEKIDTIQMARRNKRDAKKRSERPIIGDLNPLNQALPELSEIIGLSQRKTQEAQKMQKEKLLRSTMRVKDRQNLLLEESSRFKQVLRHSAFKANPFSAINLHLKNKLQEDQGS